MNSLLLTKTPQKSGTKGTSAYHSVKGTKVLRNFHPGLRHSTVQMSISRLSWQARAEDMPNPALKVLMR